MNDSTAALWHQFSLFGSQSLEKVFSCHQNWQAALRSSCSDAAILKFRSHLDSELAGGGKVEEAYGKPSEAVEMACFHFHRLQDDQAKFMLDFLAFDPSTTRSNEN